MQDDSDVRHLAYQKNNNNNNSQYNSGNASNLRFMAALSGLFPQFGVPSHQQVEPNGSQNYRLSPFVQNTQPNQQPLIMNGGLRTFKDTSSA